MSKEEDSSKPKEIKKEEDETKEPKQKSEPVL